MRQLAIHKEEFNFSAGHFTIFSATEREQLHGHNYSVSAIFDLEILGHGLSFDYRYYKKKIKSLCNEIDRHFLLPTLSPYLKITEEADHIIALFNHKKIPFLKEDVILMPLSNITIEELSAWFLEKILTEQAELMSHGIKGLTIHVFNGPGQSGGATWKP